MRYVFWLLLGLLIPAGLCAQQDALAERISLKLQGEPLAKALLLIEDKCEYVFAFQPGELPSEPISREFIDAPLSEVLTALLKPAGLEYVVRRELIIVFPFREDPLPKFFTISGYVEDAETGERLVGAAVYDVRTKRGTLSNHKGYFSLSLPRDSVHLVVSSVGYALQIEKMFMGGNRRRIVRLMPDLELEAVQIEESDTTLDMDELSGVSVMRIPLDEIERLPALMGEPDIMNALALLPGVQSGGGVSGGLYVRGGSPDQNLVMLDGVPIYNSAHLFGFYSIFNSDVLRSAELVKGGFPARYGGRLSSVLDLRTKAGNQQRLSGRGNVGLVSAKLMLEGPIVKDKTSFLVSARRSILEPYWLLVNELAEQNEGNRLGYSFFDLNAKLNQRIGARDELEVGFYTGGDRFSSGYSIAGTQITDDFDFGLRWGNTAAVARWNRDWSKKLFSDVSVFHTRYDYSADSRMQLSPVGQNPRTQSLELTSSVVDWGARMEFQYLPGPSHFVRFGAMGTRHAFQPETFQQVIETGGASNSSDLQQRALNSYEWGIFLEDNIALTRRLYLNAGLHYSRFDTDGTFYQSLQPRLSAGYSFPQHIRATASYSRMTQFLHLLSNSGVGLPTDLWVPATSTIPPQDAQQASIGLSKRFPKSGVEISLEGYYKDMDSLIDYQTGVNFLANRNWEEIVERAGKGRSYGLEVFLRKTTGRWRGWLGYTWSRTERQFANINFGRVFPYKYDRRHDVSAALILRISEKVEISANWLYGTGAAITFPEAVFYAPTSPLLGFSDLNDGESVGVIIDYGERNSFRLPAFHRLDLNLRLHKKVRWGETFWNFGVYNAYNRQNPLFLFLRADYSNNPNAPEIRARRMSLLPILPEVNFGFRF
jgi:outer membrane cobalamin receptor